MLLQTYQLDWKANFETIKGIYENLLMNIDIVIEHVGSTAIPNLMAKPIIDIDIAYFSQTDFVIIKKRLESIGYFHNGNQGVKGREVFKRIDNQHPDLDRISHHLYVCHVENEEFKHHILFRDYLNQHEEERKAYENLKIEIAEMANQDRKTYAYIKEIKARSFIERVIENLSI
jgi:GrpB-like predicted nucleotidyltransferase (UPF0157 family)